MSDFQTPPPSPYGGVNGSPKLRDVSLGSMAYGLGIAASAIAITAGYNIATEEGRGLLSRLRHTRSQRRDRNSTVLCALLASDLPVEIIRYLEGKRNVFHAAIQLSLDPEVPIESRTA